MNDQYARPPMGLKVRFFGVSVDTLAAVGPLAKRTGAAILPATSYRDEDGVTRVTLSPELDLGGTPTTRYGPPRRWPPSSREPCAPGPSNGCGCIAASRTSTGPQNGP